MSLLEAAIGNAALAGLLAIPAWVATRRLAHRPAIVHALWLVVLLKLVTPPLVEIRLPALSTGGSRELPPSVARPETPPIVRLPAEALTMDSVVMLPVGGAPHPSPIPASTPAPTLPTPTTVASAPELPAIGDALLVLWAIASGIALLVIGGRAVRLHRLLAQTGEPAPALSARVASLGRRFGLNRVPQVRELDAPVSPMLFGVGPWVRLYVPSGLREQLPPDQLDTLLLHELAHYRRGDHWVRILELIAGVVYFWHPALWMARRALHRTEEECCDAWVVSLSSDGGRDYAAALLDCIDFVSAAPRSLPLSARATGDARFLRYRMEKIMTASTPPRLSLKGRFGIGAAALVLLPGLHSHGQDLKSQPLPPAKAPSPTAEPLPEPAFPTLPAAAPKLPKAVQNPPTKSETTLFGLLQSRPPAPPPPRPTLPGAVQTKPPAPRAMLPGEAPEPVPPPSPWPLLPGEAPEPASPSSPWPPLPGGAPEPEPPSPAWPTLPGQAAPSHQTPQEALRRAMFPAPEEPRRIEIDALEQALSSLRTAHKHAPSDTLQREIIRLEQLIAATRGHERASLDARVSEEQQRANEGVQRHKEMLNLQNELMSRMNELEHWSRVVETEFRDRMRDHDMRLEQMQSQMEAERRDLENEWQSKRRDLDTERLHLQQELDRLRAHNQRR